MMLVVSTIPVRAQMMTVSQKGPLEEMSACLTGLRFCAAAEAMAADPRPASLEKRPRATPVLIAAMTAAPAAPPAAASPVKAQSRIYRMAGIMYSACTVRIYRHPMI